MKAKKILMNTVGNFFGIRRFVASLSDSVDAVDKVLIFQQIINGINKTIANALIVITL